MGQPKHLHFLGIAGYAIRGIALAAQQRGYTVTGTDEAAYPPGSDWLDQHGITWYQQADPQHLAGVDQLVINPQAAVNHPEILSAQQQQIPIISWAELVGQLTASSHRIVVAGTHGKSTTTSLLAWILHQAGHDPDYVIGAQPLNLPATVKLADSAYTVLEGDEYIASRLHRHPKFLSYHPQTVIMTAIEMDHPDVFADLAAVKDAYAQLIRQIPPGGHIISHADCNIDELTSRTDLTITTYNLEGAAIAATDIKADQQGLSFTACRSNQPIGHLHVGLFGQHNILNCLAAITVALDLGISLKTIQSALSQFTGVSRRFQRVSSTSSPMIIIEDYAHHPTEVAATLAAARQHFSGRIIAVYQPHTFSRTKQLLSDYANAFTQADEVVLLPIEAAREDADEQDISSQDIVNLLSQTASYQPSRDQLLADLTTHGQPGDIIIVMTVGGYQHLAQELVGRLEKRT